jgi:hypothetical protein
MFNKKKTKSPPRFSISCKGLDDKLLGFLVHVTVAETYAIHCELNHINGRPRDQFLASCGTVKKLIRDCGPPPELIIGLDPDEQLISNRDRIIVRISVLINGIDINALEAGPFSCDPQILMETLLINIRNEVASHQAFMGLKMREKLFWLQKELTTLKENVVLNELQILDIEKKT